MYFVFCCLDLFNGTVVFEWSYTLVVCTFALFYTCNIYILMKVECEVKLNRTEMSMIIWISGFMLKEKQENAKLGELGIGSSLLMKKPRFRWFGRVECKDDNDWISHCIVREAG